MQKVLRKRVLRDLKENLFRYIALAFLIIMGMYVIVSLIGAGYTIIDNGETHDEANKIEDGQFSVFVPLSDDEISQIEDVGTEVEQMFYEDYDVMDGKTLRVFANRKNIDLVECDEGRLAENDDEIVVEKRFSQVNEVSVGDTIQIAGNDFKVTGIGTSPDYNALFKEMSDTVVDSKVFGTVFVTEGAYDKLHATGESVKTETYLYAFRLKGKTTCDDVKDALEDIKVDTDRIDDEYFQEYWDIIEKYPLLQGGCIWDWVDQGINMPGQPADHYYFGGSFGDRPNDNDFCCNGIVTADRQVTPKLWEVKKVYQYITLEPNAENSIGVRNRYAFLNLHDFNLRYVILKDGVPIAEEEFSLPDGKPGEHRAVQIPYSRYLTSEGEYYLNLEIKLKKDCVWAKAGHIVATEQLLLQKSPNTGLQPVAVSASSKESLFKVVEEEKRYLFFRRPGVEITFDKKEGKLTGIRYNGDNMLHLREGWSLNTFRFINNDVRKWQDTQTEVISFDWKCSEDNQSAIVTIQLQETVGDVKVPYTLIYRLYGNGEIDVDASFTTNDDFNLPRLSLQAFFNPSLEQLEWYGRGPIENYRDRKNAAYVGKYQSAVNDMKESYARSQTMGGRCDTRWLTLTNKAGKGIKITAADTFDFSALHYTDKDLFEIKYGHALPDIYRAEVVLNLDCIQRGLGNASCGPGPRPAYEIQKNTVYKYAFRMSPFSK